MRIDQARERLNKNGKLPFLVTDLKDIKYLIGFEGSNGYLVIGEDDAVFISDGRYSEYASSIIDNTCRFLLQKDKPSNAILEALSTMKSNVLYVNGVDITYHFHNVLSETLTGISLLDGGDEIGILRMKKDSSELAVLEKAVNITDECTSYLYGFIRTGMTEWEISVAIENYYRTHGCRSTSFDSIVASGSGSSMPHYIPSMTKRIAIGESCMIDMGCLYEGYNSDLTRTFFVHSVSDELRKVYDIVLGAQLSAIDSVKPGITTGELDSIARSFISDAGYGSMFGHSLGHGVGLDIHEEPSVRKGGETVLEPGMVITIEPGIYIPGKGGVRIEDMVTVTDTGCRILTKYPKALSFIG